MTVFGLNPYEWNAVAAIATSFAAIATFLTVGVALWLARTPKKPKLVGSIYLEIGPKSIDMHGDETPYKSPPPDWIEDKEILKSFRCEIRNLSDNPARAAVFYYKEKLLEKKKIFQFIDGDGAIGPQGDSQLFSMPYMKINASSIRKVWIADTMDRKWLLDISQVKRLQKELKKWKRSKERKNGNVR